MNYLDSILKEERTYADIANEERAKTKKISLIFQIVIFIIGIYLVFTLIKKIKKDKKEIKKMSDINVTRYPYYRELPYKNMTAGDIAYIYYYRNDKMSKKLNKVFSANVLSLFLKGCISLEKNSKKEIVITINKNIKSTKELLRDENTVFNIFVDAEKKLKNSFTMREFRKYINKLDAQKIADKFDEMKLEAERNARKQKIYSSTNKKIRDKYKSKHEMIILMMGLMFIIFMVGAGLSVNSFFSISFLILMLVYESLLISDLIIIKKILNKSRNLTEKGMDYLSKLKGLKRYIEDFSFMKERETMDVVLWREYLVVAVVLGVSNKVIKELLNEIPKLSKETCDCYTNFIKGTNVIRKKVDSARRFYDISISDYSSGEGFGGGFSSGGGRRSVALVALVEDKFEIKNKFVFTVSK